MMEQGKGQRGVWALSGVLFAVFFLGGEFLRSMLASGSLPLPDAPASEVVDYFAANQSAALVVGLCQVLAALSLFAFVSPVVGALRRRASGALPGLAAVGGIASAALLFLCALLGLTLALTSSGIGLGAVETLREINFLTGGTLHVATLGVFVGATSLAARGAKVLPAWICWLGIVVGAIAILSLASLFVYYANAFILFGRMLGFVWCVSAGIVLLFAGNR